MKKVVIAYLFVNVGRLHLVMFESSLLFGLTYADRIHGS